MKKLLLLLLVTFTGNFLNAQTVHLTGDGVGGWNNPPLARNQMTTTDNVNYAISNVQITGSGSAAEFKFMINSDWGMTYGFTGASGFPSGVAGNGGGNIVGVAGFWNVTYNRTTGAYNFTAGVNPNAAINITSANSPISMITSDGISYGSPSTTLAAGTYNFAQSGSANTWGNAAFPSGTATPGGTGTSVPQGTYNIGFNKNTGAYSFLPVAVGMIGIGSPSGNWNSDAMMTTTDAVVYRINNAAITGDSMKFRDNTSWTYQFGTNGAANTNTFPSGTAIPNGNDMLTVSGTYNITFNRSTGAYNFQNVLSNASFAKNFFTVSPNPSSTRWDFATDNQSIESIKVYDILGKLVLETSPKSDTTSVEISDLTNGVYFAKVSSATATETIKLMKN